MRGTALMALALALSGCAATVNPQKAVAQLDAKGRKYNTIACREARENAVGYDDMVGERVGIGIAAGLMLGPFGMPIALAADMSQAEKRNAVLKELNINCQGEVMYISDADDALSEMEVQLQLLKHMRAQGLVTDADSQSSEIRSSTAR